MKHTKAELLRLKGVFSEGQGRRLEHPTQPPIPLWGPRGSPTGPHPQTAMQPPGKLFRYHNDDNSSLLSNYCVQGMARPFTSISHVLLRTPYKGTIILTLKSERNCLKKTY